MSVSVYSGVQGSRCIYTIKHPQALVQILGDCRLWYTSFLGNMSLLYACTGVTMKPEELKLSKVFHENTHHITSVDFDSTGEYCLTGCPEDESINLYDCRDGLHRKTVFSKKYGVGPVRFTHHHNNVIYSSAKGNPSELGIIRYVYFAILVLIAPRFQISVASRQRLPTLFLRPYQSRLGSGNVSKQ